MAEILTVKNLQKKFGSLVAVDNLSFDVTRGEILGMMGPNGAGKTTVFNLLTGLVKPDKGQVIFGGRDITYESPSKRCRQGIGRTHQVPRPFNKMTVYENLLVAAVHGGGLTEKQARDEIGDILEAIGLFQSRNNLAGGLPLLDRKRLELGRAISSRPNLVLLDEVAGGLTEAETHQVLRIVKNIQERGVSIIWIEHVLVTMTEGVDRLLVISEGRWLKCGDPHEVMASKEVLESYMGVEEN